MLPTTRTTARRATPSKGRHPLSHACPAGMWGVYRGRYAEARALRGPCGVDLMPPVRSAARAAGLHHHALATPKTGRTPRLGRSAPAVGHAGARQGMAGRMQVRTKIPVRGLWIERANR